MPINSLFLEDDPFFDMPYDPRPYATISVHQQSNSWLIDTGAVACVIAYSSDAQLETYRSVLRPTDITISTLHTVRKPATGIADLVYDFDGIKQTIPTVLIEASRSQFVAGVPFMRAFNIILKIEPNYYGKHRRKFRSAIVTAKPKRKRQPCVDGQETIEKSELETEHQNRRRAKQKPGRSHCGRPPEERL